MHAEDGLGLSNPKNLGNSSQDCEFFRADLQNFHYLGFSNAETPGSFRIGAVQCRDPLNFQDCEAFPCKHPPWGSTGSEFFRARIPCLCQYGVETCEIPEAFERKSELELDAVTWCCPDFCNELQKEVIGPRWYSEMHTVIGCLHARIWKNCFYVHSSPSDAHGRFS